MRILNNTIVVLAVTVLTAFAVYAGVETIGVPSAVTAAVTGGDGSGTLTCPATGCSAVSCHGSSGTSAPRYGTPGGSGTTGTFTCPETGCTASSCHATSGDDDHERGHNSPGIRSDAGGGTPGA